MPKMLVKKSACVVGERCNGRRRTHWDAASVDVWAEFTWTVAAFFDGPSRSKLLSVGLDWHRVKCVNLLSPSPVVGEWDSERARAVAAAMDFSEFDLVFVCGVKACSAMGFTDKLSDCIGQVVHGSSRKIVPLPHPSGLNRFWNDGAAVTSLKNKIAKLLQ